ncbi:MAG: hypothetical protein M3347_14825, partial [Armatimonadota bacterium]|nr:hypothetical protein [Armatimonadota bacterium]
MKEKKDTTGNRVKYSSHPATKMLRGKDRTAYGDSRTGASGNLSKLITIPKIVAVIGLAAIVTTTCSSCGSSGSGRSGASSYPSQPRTRNIDDVSYTDVVRDLDDRQRRDMAEVERKYPPQPADPSGSPYTQGPAY